MGGEAGLTSPYLSILRQALESGTAHSPRGLIPIPIFIGTIRAQPSLFEDPDNTRSF
jgi:hypothetical protein